MTDLHYLVPNRGFEEGSLQSLAWFENNSRLKSVVHRVERLHGDFQGRLLPKWERMLAFIHILASEWWHT